MNAIPPRASTLSIDPDMLARWSPRGFGDAAITEIELMTMLEAARWAPSAFNAQPWHFIHARRDSAHWPTLLALLSAFNRDWAQHASALVFLASRTTRTSSTGEVSLSRSHAFDAGAAWSMLALQATKLGWHAHAMAGLDHDAALRDLHLPEGWRIEIAIAIGKRGAGEHLSESLRARDVPSQRRPLSEVTSEGRFPPTAL